MTDSAHTPADPSRPEPWHTAWPVAGLESVNACPVCQHPGSALAHEGLVDNTFRCARGRWTLWRCQACGSGYLNPRPSIDTIHTAYEHYYTHHPAASGDGGSAHAAPLRRLRRSLANGYARWRYGMADEPSSRWGVVAALLLPLRRSAVDGEYRHLPHRPSGRKGRLLDVGCGDGSFLALAQRCGWDVLGLEPDPKAAQLAQQRGLTVITSGLESLASQADCFDVITLSHVIEHLHEPLQMLRACHRLLKPGGQLWIATPNVESLGHRLFGKHWRGLEAPRHLVLFSAHSLVLALKQAGFSASQALAMPSPRRWLFERSWAMSQGRWPDDVLRLPAALRWRAFGADLRELFLRETPEFLTMSAQKPR